VHLNSLWKISAKILPDLCIVFCCDIAMSFDVHASEQNKKTQMMDLSSPEHTDWMNYHSPVQIPFLINSSSEA